MVTAAAAPGPAAPPTAAPPASEEVAPEAPPAAPPALQAQPRPAPFKRLDLLPEAMLREQLLAVPEVALNRVPNTSKVLLAAARASTGRPYPGPAALLPTHPALIGLPFVADRASRLGKEQAKDLDALSKALHRHVQACTSVEGTRERLDLARLRQLLAEPQKGPAPWCSPRALPALLQILQVEEAPARRLLVGLLAEIDDPRAHSALAVRAVVDPSPEVRQAAVRALAGRPAASYRGALLAGLRYPWPPAVAHAAEALVALRDKEAVPALQALLDGPAPGLPVEAVPALPQSRAVRELVRVNHLKNCLLCHPPSFQDQDPVRGAVPEPGRSLGGYGGGLLDDFVRADVTYLRQDFSLRQFVERHPEGWPDMQRFDYLVRVRPATAKDVRRLREKQESMTREYREAVQFALRELADGAAP